MTVTLAERVRAALLDLGYREFDPMQPRDGDGKWSKNPAAAAADFAEKVAKALSRDAALDSAPVHLADAPGRHGGKYDGARFSQAPPGHGDPLAVAEMEGLEYEETNSYLWERATGRDITVDGSGNPFKPAELEYWAKRHAQTQHRVDEVDKTLAVSPLPHDVVVHRGVKSGSDTFGAETWFGLTPRLPGEKPDFAREDAEWERFESGWRPDLTGMEWTQHSYLHTTVRDELMTEYAKNHGGLTHMPVAMRILLPAGVPAIRMSDMDKESELMAARGLRLRVVKDHGEDSDGVRRLDVEVVGHEAAA